MPYVVYKTVPFFSLFFFFFIPPDDKYPSCFFYKKCTEFVLAGALEARC